MTKLSSDEIPFELLPEHEGRFRNSRRGENYIIVEYARIFALKVKGQDKFEEDEDKAKRILLRSVDETIANCIDAEWSVKKTFASITDMMGHRLPVKVHEAQVAELVFNSLRD